MELFEDILRLYRCLQSQMPAYVIHKAIILRRVNNLKRFGVLLLFVMILGCTSQSENTKNASGTATPLSTSQTTNSPISGNQSLSPSNDQTIIDEKKYSGQELDLVQIINKSTKLLNDRNESEYLALLAKGSPISQLNKKKITRIEVVSIGPINKDTASVETKIWMDTEPETTKLYSFTKEDDVWKIYDID